MGITANDRDEQVWRYQAPPAFSECQRQRWQALLESRTGISYALHTSILQAGVYRRMFERGYTDYDQYFNAVNSKGIAGQREWRELLNYVTVQDTRFFRDSYSFGYLQADLLQRIPALAKRNDTLEMWSAGCASGEEAWSLALLARQCIEQSRCQLYFGVLGSDICSGALATAREGIYRESQLANVDMPIYQRWLTPVGDRRFRIAREIAQRVCFVTANLAVPGEGISGKMDIIICQNVLIYFNQRCRDKVLDGLMTQLKPGGMLLLGAGESGSWQHRHATRVRCRQLEAYTHSG